jgi:hypothetical protein
MRMTVKTRFGEESPAVQGHLSILQSVIQRMATNSGSCKAWCITLVSAILVVVADKAKASYALIAAVPTILFFVLDAYYLALERGFRASYRAFIRKLHSGGVAPEDLYEVSPEGALIWTFFRSIFSFSIWPFYVTLALLIWLTQRVVMR